VSSPPAAATVRSDPPVTQVRPTFREVFDNEGRYVWRALLGLGVAEADVPDVSQQVFLVLHDRLGRLEEGCTLRTFVYSICIRVASDYRRRAHRRYERLCAAPPEAVHGADQENVVSRRQALTLLEAALTALTDDQREVFVLFEIEELTMADVAVAIGRPLQTAYSRLHAARKAVAARLGTQLKDEGFWR
jgi:RNA polymerase sigma-70 factor (ECF subfamily)